MFSLRSWVSSSRAELPSSIRTTAIRIYSTTYPVLATQVQRILQSRRADRVLDLARDFDFTVDLSDPAYRRILLMRNRQYLPVLQSALALAIVLQLAGGAMALKQHSDIAQNIEAQKQSRVAAQTVSQQLTPPRPDAAFSSARASIGQPSAGQATADFLSPPAAESLLQIPGSTYP